VKRVRTLADRDEMPPRNVMQSRRPAHAVVMVFSNDLAGIDAALRLVRKQRGESGLARLMRPQSTLFAHYKPADRKRIKSGRHRAAMRKAEAKYAAWELHREARRNGVLKRKYEGMVSAAA
jgi:hypothetical protein